MAPGLRLRFRHTWRAVKVVLIVFVAFGASYAIQGVAGRPDAAPVPETFGLPAPNLGDRGVYDLALRQDRLGPDKTLLEGRAVEFEWGEDSVALGPDGRWQPVHALYQYTDPMGEDDDEGVPAGFVGGPDPDLGPRHRQQAYRFASNDWALLSLSHRVDAHWTEAYAVDGGWETMERDFDRRTETFTFPDEHVAGEPFCGFVNALQQAKVDLGQPFVFATKCNVGLQWHEAIEVQADRAEIRAGVLYVRLVQVGDVDHRVVFWVAEGHPYPSQVEVRHERHAGLRSVYTLYQDARGARPLQRGPASPTPALEVVTQDGSFPDLDGSHLGASLREATETLKASGAWAGYIGTTPNATLVAASSSYEDSDGQTVRQWTFEFGQETRVDLFHVDLKDRSATVTGPFVRTTWTGARPIAAPPAAPPVTMPTLASLEDAWSTWVHVMGLNVTLTDWGFDASGAPECGEPCSSAWVGTAGRHWTSAEGTTDGRHGTKRDEEVTLRFSSDGRILSTKVDQTRVTTLPVETPPAEATIVQGGQFQTAQVTRQVVLPREVWWSGALALLVGAGAAVVQYAGRGWFALFSRLSHERLLDHPARAAIAAAVAAAPGIQYLRLARAVELPRSTMEHHLRKLLDAGVVVQVQGNGMACYFRKGAVDHRVMTAVPFVSAESARKIAEAATQAPGASMSELALATGLQLDTVAYHAHRLERHGLAITRRNGSRVQVDLTSVGLAALAVCRRPTTDSA